MTPDPRPLSDQDCALGDAMDALKRAARAVEMARNVDLDCIDGKRSQARFVAVALREAEHARRVLVRERFGVPRGKAGA